MELFSWDQRMKIEYPQYTRHIQAILWALEEQSRIVGMVNDLTAICDQLKQRLRDSQQT